MGLAHSPKTVTGGLVVAVDPVNTKSYPGTGNTIFDLSGNGNDFTSTTFNTTSNATAGTVYDADNSLDTIVDLSTNINHEVWSVMLWVRSTGVTPSNYKSIFRLEDTTSIPVYFYQFDTRETTNCRIMGYHKHFNGTVSNDEWMTYDFTNSSQWLTGDWFCFGVSHNNTNFRNYRNGKLLATQTQTLDVTGYNDINRIRFNASNNNAFQMGPLMVYDRVLTDAEFEQNFNALRGRFGI